MKRFILLLAFVVLASTSALARDLVARSPISQERSLRWIIPDTPPPDPPPPPPPDDPDQKAGVSVTELSWIQDVADVANRTLGVAVCHRSTTNTITSVVSDVDGALSLIDWDAHPTGIYVASAVYRLINPTVGQHRITVTFSVSQNAAADSFVHTDTNQTTPWGTITLSSGTGNPSTNIASTTSRGTIDFLCISQPTAGTITAGANQTERSALNIGITDFTNRKVRITEKDGDTSVTFSYTQSGNDYYLHRVWDIRNPSDSGDAPPPFTGAYIQNKNWEDGSTTSSVSTLGTCYADGVSQAISEAPNPVFQGTRSGKIVLNSAWSPIDTDPALRVSPTPPSWMCASGQRLIRGVHYKWGIGPKTYGFERWYGVAIYIDSTWDDDSTDPNGTVVFSLHSNPDTGEGAKTGQFGIEVGKGPNERWRIRNIYDATAISTSATWTRTYYDGGLVSKGQWTKWVVHAIWAYDNTGVLEVWKDGVKILDRQNLPNAYNDQTPQFNEMGIYKSWWNVSTSDWPTTLTAYFDCWRITDGTGNFNAVDPTTC